MNDKQSLRSHIQSLTKSISLDEKRSRATVLWSKVEQMAVFHEAKTILFYRSLDDEVDTHSFIRKRYTQKNIILPCIQDDHLISRRFRGEEDMIYGQHFSLAEPQGEIVGYDEIDLAFIPGVAFDRQGNRLGRGKGYYDRLLPYLHCSKIGICFDRQVVDSIPREGHDRGVDEVIIA